MTDELTPELIAEAEEAIREYGQARIKFRRVQDRLKKSKLLFGNDNKVGIAGEFWALRLYIARGFRLHEVPKYSNNPGHDFIVHRPDAGTRYVQVKAITAENQNGTTSMVGIADGWDELCIVQMDEKLSPERFGIASMDTFKTRCRPSGRMPADRRWLDQGWMEIALPNF